jgi:hypothetical protein
VRTWTSEVVEQTKIADAARKGVDFNNPDSNVLSSISDAEKSKLEVAEKALDEVKRRAARSSDKVRAENERVARFEFERIQTEKHAENVLTFKNLPVNNEAFVPPPVVVDSSPSYAETVEFLGEKFGMKIGFGETSRKLIYRTDYETFAFDPKDISPDLIMRADPFGGSSVSVDCRNNRQKIERFTSSAKPENVSGFRVHVRNSIDQEKLASALSHLVSILGATKEAF